MIPYYLLWRKGELSVQVITGSADCQSQQQKCNEHLICAECILQTTIWLYFKFHSNKILKARDLLVIMGEWWFQLAIWWAKDDMVYQASRLRLTQNHE